MSETKVEVSKERIYSIMKLNKLTLADLSDATGYSRTVLSEKLSSGLIPKSMWYSIKNYLNITLDDASPIKTITLTTNDFTEVKEVTLSKHSLDDLYKVMYAAFYDALNVSLNKRGNK